MSSGHHGSPTPQKFGTVWWPLPEHTRCRLSEGSTTQTGGDNTFLAAAVLWNKTASNPTNNANRLDSLFKKSIHVRQNSYFST